ncbi:DUF5659 domain-containing protein [Clostridium beijerinckii]|uniref:DUF5659 domain-containing protein n=1 Tax=Clostridium beijerinckii TaxID=1520 RepID=A0AAW3W550_CLOBE|nr:DUF5659 domain-containing protein [Clostridium beijerinckii]MBC2456601.1 hypothetical protein [Clostridium beijerinckii]MBC2473923.1 hypothetical protein [Clostridium beijerinckii]NOV63287.1 hypothetical protein [Clostridium beijerinckii]NOV69750.1 hypothetical protein [Clostridium beijerinckii]NOW31343.1 hypothetical protein [Clostridium beijerinckii]
MENTTIATINSMPVAGYLMMKGFILLDKKRNYNNQERWVYYFKESSELRQTMSEYKKAKEILENNI